MTTTKEFPNDIQFVLGDCLKELPNVANESVDAIYLDPPFDSNRIYKLSAESDVGFDDKWKEEDYTPIINDQWPPNE